jgi:hypothetical protein
LIFIVTCSVVTFAVRNFFQHPIVESSTSWINNPIAMD